MTVKGYVTMRLILTACLSLLCIFGLARPSVAELSAAQVKQLALEAILENPEIIREAIDLLRQNDKNAAAVKSQALLQNERDRLERDPNAPTLGNLDGDVTIVEFFDYNCPYCKRATAELNTLLAQDTNVRVILREWPILGEASVYATRASLAARKQDKYAAFHQALMVAKGRVGPANVMVIAQAVGLDTQRLKADMQGPEIDQHIETSMQLAQALNFSGTPAYVIGNELAPGMVSSDDLQALVSQARAAQ
jgi:protein-disulfide isomerase